MSELRETCDYLMIPFDEKTIKTHNICKALFSTCFFPASFFPPLFVTAAVQSYLSAPSSSSSSSGDFLNELSNDGARQQFEKYLQEDLLPAMVQYARVSGDMFYNPNNSHPLFGNVTCKGQSTDQHLFNDIIMHEYVVPRQLKMAHILI